MGVERRARAIAADLRAEQWEASPRRMIARQAALTLEALDEARAVYRQLEESILEAECRIGTELLKVKQHEPELFLHQFRLQGFLMSLAAERRRLSVLEHERLGELQMRLLVLVHRHAQLAAEDD